MGFTEYFHIITKTKSVTNRSTSQDSLMFGLEDIQEDQEATDLNSELKINMRRSYVDEEKLPLLRIESNI